MDAKKRGELLAPTVEKLQKFGEMITNALFSPPFHDIIYRQKLRDTQEVEKILEHDNQITVKTLEASQQDSNTPSPVVQEQSSTSTLPSETSKEISSTPSSPLKNNVDETCINTNTIKSTTNVIKSPEDELIEENYKKRKIEVEVDWDSFNELFNTLFNEGAPEVIDTILNSFFSKSCAASLVGTLIAHCKPPQSNHERSKHVYIRDFLQQNLQKYIIKYSDDSRDVGYYRDGVIVDYVEIEVNQEEEIQWIVRDITKNIDKSTDVQQFIIDRYYIPELERRIMNDFLHPLKLQVCWDHMKYAAIDYGRAVERIYKDNSNFILEQIYAAISDICAYEEDDLVDALSLGLSTIAITLQPNPHSAIGEKPKKDFDVDEATKTLTLRYVLEGNDANGWFFKDDLKPIIKIAGLYNTDVTPLFKHDLLSAVAQLYKVREYSDLSYLKRVLTRESLKWWQPSENEKKVMEKARIFINENRKLAKLEHSAVGQLINNNGTQTPPMDESIMSNYESVEDLDDDDENNPYREEIIKGWHVVKVNKHQVSQYRYLILTDKAYWTLKFDEKTGKFDPKHYKRHDICNFYFCEQGDVEETKGGCIQALKVYLHEKRRKGVFSYGEENAFEQGGRGRKKSVMSVRPSIAYNPDSIEGQQFQLLQNLTYQLLQQSGVPKTRVKKQKKERIRPERTKDIAEYASVFLPHSDAREFDAFDIKAILTEIAWTLFAVASANSKKIHNNYRVIEPFFNVKDFTVPKSKWFSPLLNLPIFSTKKAPKREVIKIERKKGDKSHLTSQDETIAIEDKKSPEYVTAKQPQANVQPLKSILIIRSEVRNGPTINPNQPKENSGAYTPVGVGVTSKEKGRRVIFKDKARVFYTGNEEDQNSGFYAVDEDLIDEEEPQN
ncbi:hypothetical protein ABK040_000642 [Willaertia magna]